MRRGFSFPKGQAVLTGVTGLAIVVSGCSSAEVKPMPPVAAPEPPAFTQVLHPEGFDIADLESLMTDKAAPPAEKLENCDADYLKLLEATVSEDERARGVTELIFTDPVKYHWCFYFKVRHLDQAVKAADYVEDRQKSVIDAYRFLVPVARAFMSGFQDTRYLRWSIRHYKRLSEHVFFRKLELSPAGTAELVEASNPIGLYRVPRPTSQVLDKYKIKVEVGEGEILPAPPGADVAATDPAAAATPGDAAKSAAEVATAGEAAKPAAQVATAPASAAAKPAAQVATAPASAAAKPAAQVATATKTRPQGAAIPADAKSAATRAPAGTAPAIVQE